MGATPPKGCFSAVRRPRVSRRSSARGANANPAGQIPSLVRRVGRPSLRGVFLRGTNPFARAPCRDAFVEGRVPARHKSFRLRAVSGGLRRGAYSCAGQIPSLVRRVGMLSPRRAFLRGANPFARAPCREAFAEESVLARHKSFRSCAVSGDLRRGACSCAGQILSLVRRVGRLSPRGAFSRGGKFFCSCAVSGGFRRGERRPAGGAGSACGLGGRSSPRVGLPKALL